jgi:hypothetical protein
MYCTILDRGTHDRGEKPVLFIEFMLYFSQSCPLFRLSDLSACSDVDVLHQTYISTVLSCSASLCALLSKVNGC